MPVDARIPLTVQPQQIDLASVYARIAQNRATAARERERQEDRALDKKLKLRAVEDEEEVRRILGEPGEMNDERLARLGRVSPDLRFKFEDQRSQQASQAAARKAAEERARQEEIDSKIKQFDISGRVMAGAKDQPSYDLALSTLKQLGISIDHMPPVFDPATVKTATEQSAIMKGHLVTNRTHWITGTDENGESFAVSVEDRPGQRIPLGRKTTAAGGDNEPTEVINVGGKPVIVRRSEAIGKERFYAGRTGGGRAAGSGRSTAPTTAQRAAAERFKFTELQKLEAAIAESEDGIAENVLDRRKLSIENAYRAQLGMPQLKELPAEWKRGRTPQSSPAPTQGKRNDPINILD